MLRICGSLLFNHQNIRPFAAPPPACIRRKMLMTKACSASRHAHACSALSLSSSVQPALSRRDPQFQRRKKPWNTVTAFPLRSTLPLLSPLQTVARTVPLRAEAWYPFKESLHASKNSGGRRNTAVWMRWGNRHSWCDGALHDWYQYRTCARVSLSVWPPGEVCRARRVTEVEVENNGTSKGVSRAMSGCWCWFEGLPYGGRAAGVADFLVIDCRPRPNSTCRIELANGLYMSTTLARHAIWTYGVSPSTTVSTGPEIRQTGQALHAY